MCGCGRIFTTGVTINEIVQDASLRQDLTQYKMISSKEFKEGRVLPILQYAYCMDADQFRQIFKNVGLTVDPLDLPVLAGVIERGDDKKGQLLNDSGQPIYIDAMGLVRNMKFTPEQIQRNQCSIAFV